MNASTFIKVALIDQMQQIADLGLWYHVAKLIPSGVELLARVVERNENDGFTWGERNHENLAISDYVPIGTFCEKYFPPDYYKHSACHGAVSFFSVSGRRWLTSDPDHAEKHLTEDADGFRFIHVPTWFADFKAACETVLKEIDSGKIKDIEVLKMVKQQKK